MVLVALLACLGGCGSAARSRVVVRVDGAAISESEVTHWARVATRGGSLGGVPTSPRETPRERAVRFLISTNWLLAEAATHGSTASSRGAERKLKREEAASPGGTQEFRRALAATDMTVADARLEIRRELAASALARLSIDAARISRGELRAYYKTHRARFRVPEARDVDLVEHIPSRAAARRLAPRLAAAATSSPLWRYHESLTPPAAFDTHTEKGRLVRAIFTAVPGRLYGPMRLSRQYAMFVVREVKPAATRPLAQVEAVIYRRLAAARRKQLAAGFFAAYRSRWTARTSCSPGFVVQGCRRYRGPQAEEVNPFAGE